jgi:TATA-box binding protein (TBP) (component of TFIID and TFIIIB)
MDLFLSTTCDICNQPTFICQCINVVDSLKMCCGKCENGVVYTNISVSTMTVCFNFNNEINLKVLNESFPKGVDVSYKPGSKKSKVPKKKGTDSFYNSFDIKLTILDRETGLFSNVSIFIFPNGKVKAAGAKNLNTINLLIEELIELIKFIPESVIDPDTLAAENIKIQMICSDFKIKPIKDDPDGWCLKQEELKNILVKEHSLSATFSALSRYPGINMKYPSIIGDKMVSLLIFRSGSIIITGAKNTKDIYNSYKFITDVIIKNKDVLFYYDINEDIKQKKKKNIK